jgi:hypothetical protein
VFSFLRAGWKVCGTQSHFFFFFDYSLFIFRFTSSWTDMWVLPEVDGMVLLGLDKMFSTL